MRSLKGLERGTSFKGKKWGWFRVAIEEEVEAMAMAMWTVGFWREGIG
jgi:hypothetical protein